MFYYSCLVLHHKTLCKEFISSYFTIVISVAKFKLSIKGTFADVFKVIKKNKEEKQVKKA